MNKREHDSKRRRSLLTDSASNEGEEEAGVSGDLWRDLELKTADN